MFQTEQLAYWFLRLNGCTTIVNFVVHHERRGRVGTEVDILAVRFPFRRELSLSGQPMTDHALFDCGDRIDIVIAEVKKGQCALNRPWTDPTKENMRRVLDAIGAIPEAEVDDVAAALYDPGGYSNDRYRLRLVAVGQHDNQNLGPQVVQMCWPDVLAFIFDRLSLYRNVKREHLRWDRTGQELYDEVMQHGSRESFIQCVLEHLTEKKYGD